MHFWIYYDINVIERKLLIITILSFIFTSQTGTFSSQEKNQLCVKIHLRIMKAMISIFFSVSSTIDIRPNWTEKPCGLH